MSNLLGIKLRTKISRCVILLTGISVCEKESVRLGIRIVLALWKLREDCLMRQHEDVLG